jgi:hypothetical protein
MILFKGFALAKIYKKNIRKIIKEDDAKLIYVEIYESKIHRFIDSDKYLVYKKFCANNSWIGNGEIIQILIPTEDTLIKKDHIIINIENNS